MPRRYQRGFADGELIEMRFVGQPGSRVVPVSKAGVVKDAYLRHRPRDGTPIHDIEWSLRHIDHAAPRYLRGLSDRWPLSMEEKVIVAEFIAIQMLRGPRWREWHNTFTRKLLDEYAETAFLERPTPHGVSSQEARNHGEAALTSDTAR